MEGRCWRKAKLIACLAGLLLVSGCTDSNEDHEERSVASVTVTPDYAELSPDGDKCDDGQSRPCFQPIRKRPERGPATPETVMNAILERPEGIEAAWPYEAYNGSAGDPYNVVCQVRGEPIRDSDIWDVVLVPREHMNNETIAEIETDGKTSYGVIKNQDGEMVAALGYAPNKWAGDHGIYEELDACTTAQNPAGFPSV